MKKILLAVLLITGLSAFAADHPITIRLVKKAPNQYTLKVSVPEGFGIQRDAPNRILLGGNGVKVEKADLKFSGPVHHKKKEYYEYVNEMSLTLAGKGSLQITGRIYYCDFNKNICIPGKVMQEEKIN